MIHRLWPILLSVSLMYSCGPSAPPLTTSDGTVLDADRGISGQVTGNKVGEKTKIAVFGSFTNISGNKISAENKTIEADITLAFAPVKEGKYNFALPKGPQKAQAANFKVFAFNDANDNNAFDEGEDKSNEASIQWAIGVGYKTAIDPDGNPVVDLFNDFKDFDFKLGE